MPSRETAPYAGSNVVARIRNAFVVLLEYFVNSSDFLLGVNLKLMTVPLLSSFLCGIAVAEDSQRAIQTETLIQTTSAWDGMPYKTYPGGQPQITVLRVTIPPHTVMKWHSHPIPNAGYILVGDLTIEKKDGTRRHFVAGQAITETVDSVHRGLTGSEPAVVIVFYAGAVGKSLSY
jgi:quercetin dioxygenase-like cupin family protein